MYYSKTGAHQPDLSISIVVWAEEDRVRLARSAAVSSRRTARGLPLMSFLYLRLNSCAQRLRSIKRLQIQLTSAAGLKG